MSNRDDDFYRGDPPRGSTAAGAGQQPSSSAPADRDQTTHLPQPGQGPQPGHNPPPGYAPPGQAAPGPAQVSGAPGYGAPGYGAPPGYGPPPGYGTPPAYGPAYGTPPGYPPQPYGMPGWPRPTNTMAVLALVMAFVFAPAGLVLGIIARRQIQRTGEEGNGLALAGIIIGGIATAFFVLALVAWIIAFASLGSDFN